MVVPCFKEQPECFMRIPTPPIGQSLLVIGVLNRPETDPDLSANAPLRHYVEERATSSPVPGTTLCTLAPAVTPVSYTHLTLPTTPYV